jgi:uroporphyrin-3 C-methyltransferase
MTDTPVAVTASESPAPQPAKAAPVRPVKTGRVMAWFAFLLNLLLIATLAAAIWWLWPQWAALQQQQQLLAQQQQQQNEQGQQQYQQLSEQLQQQLASLAEQQKQQGLLAQQQQQALLQLQLESKKQLSSGRTWQLWQIQQLLQLTGQKIWLEQDMAAALRLLQGAEQQLALLQDPSMQALRQAIQQDLAQLQQHSLPDVTKIQLELSSLRQLVLDLPLRQAKHQLGESQPVAAADQSWQATLLQHWQLFWGSLVHVRPTEAEDLSVLTAAEQLTLRNSLQQQLVLAGLAAMKHQPELYQQALQQAMDMLQRYFAAVDPKVSAAAEQLVRLADLPVVFPTPAALESSLVLEQLMRQNMVESGQ